MEQNRYKNLIINTILITVGGALTKIVGFVMLPFYTAWLSTEEYGTVDLIGVYAAILMSMTTLCLGESIFVFVKNCKERDRTAYFTTNILFSFLCISFIGILLYCFHYYSEINGIHNTFADHTSFIYMYVVSGYLQLITQQFACAINEIKVYSMTGVVVSVSTAVLSFLLIPEYDITGFIYAGVLSNMIGMGYTFIFSCSYRYINLCSINKKYLMEMLKYSIPVMPNSILGWLTIALNRPVMEKYLGLSAIGIFSVSNKFPQLIQLTFNYFSTSWNISLFEEYSKPSFESFFNRIAKVVFMGLLLVSSLLIIFGEAVVKIIADENFYDSYIYIPILSIGTLFLCMSQFLGSLYAVNKKSQYYFYTSFWSSITAVVLNFLLIPLYGIYGASFSLLCSYFVYMIARLFISRKYVKLHNYSFYLYQLFGLFLISMAVWINISTVYICLGYLIFESFLLYKQRVVMMSLFAYVRKTIKR